MRRYQLRRAVTASTGDGVPAQARAAFQAGLTDAVADLTRVGDMYVAWARRDGNRAELAEAYWLSTAALPALLPHLDGDEEIALIPLGALNLLPISAAFLQATAGRPAGPLTVRLLPNARVAVNAGWPPGRLTSHVLVADATRAPAGEPLPRSSQEAEALVRRYGAHRLSDATSETALSAMDTASLVHFFCHGRADLADPLSSGLRLMDGWMTVKTMFARRPLRPQLVILSACESQVSGHAAPDEVIGLPAALFQAGAAGVIASQWKVSEQVALLTMRKFYDQLDTGAAPARALTAAQNWLRTATKDELISSYPDLFTVARGISGWKVPGSADAEPPYGNPVCWAALRHTEMGFGHLPVVRRHHPMTETSMTPRRAYQRLDRRLGAVTPEELAAVRRILRIPGSVSPP